MRLRISETHEWRLSGSDWGLHFLPSDEADVPLRLASRFERELLEAAKREIECGARAFEIADESMYELLFAHGFHSAADAARIGLCSPSNVECPPQSVKTLAEADPAIREAFEWLQPRGFVELASDSDGDYVRVLREPGAA